METRIDQERIDDYLGMTLLIGVTYLDHRDQVIEVKQWHGTITAISETEGIVVTLAGEGEGEECRLPPDLSALKWAEPGTYRLRSTGEAVVDPDYFTTWTCRLPPPDEDTA